MLVRISIISVFTILLSGTIMSAMAATEVRDPPSNLAIWIFLGFCALIIVAELGTLVRWGQKKQSDEAVEHKTSTELLKPQ